MKILSPVQSKRGYTLTEVILAMSVVAVAVPMILGLVVAGGESSRKAERETRAVITARSVFEELSLASRGNSEFISELDLPWSEAEVNAGQEGGGGGGTIGDSSDEDDWLLLELNRDGDILGVATGMEYEGRWEGEGLDVTGIAAVRGYLEEVEGVVLTDGELLTVFRVEVRVEAPARAELKDRDSFSFLKTESLR